MNDWSKDIDLETIKEYLQECAENDDYHYEQYQVDLVMHEYIRQKQIIERLKEQLNDEIDDELKQSEIMVKQQNEMERQKEIIRQLDIKNLELTTIIKEVRGKLYDLNYKIKEIHNVPFDISEIFEMIEILDKADINV